MSVQHMLELMMNIKYHQCESDAISLKLSIEIKVKCFNTMQKSEIMVTEVFIKKQSTASNAFSFSNCNPDSLSKVGVLNHRYAL